MSVIKFNPSKESERWDSIPRKTLQDTSISSTAFQLLMFLLSQPSSWRVSNAHLQKEFIWGKNKVAIAIKELKNAGYLETDQTREKGMFGSVEYIVHPIKQPLLENGATVNGATVDGAAVDAPLENTDSENTDIDINYNKNLENENVDDQPAIAKPEPKSTKQTKSKKLNDEFNQFWDAYSVKGIPSPKKGNRINAHKSFVKALRIITFDELMAALERYKKYVISQKFYGYKHASTWLNQSDWLTYPAEKTKAEVAAVIDWDAAVKTYKTQGYFPAPGASPIDPERCEAPTKILVKYGYWQEATA